MRTDIHRPSVIKPEEYEFVAFDYIKIGESGNILADCAYLQEQRRTKAEHMNRTGGKYSTHEHGGNCMVCGSVNAIYTATFYHRPSNSYVRVGSDCTDKMYAAGDAGIETGFNLFRRNIQNALEAQAGKKKAAAILEAAGLSAAWGIYTADYKDLPGKERQRPNGVCAACWRHKNTIINELCDECRADVDAKPATMKDIYYEEMTIRDIVGKLVKYGSISDKATAYIKTLLGKIQDRPALEEKKAAEQAAAADCPTGRVQITGTVLGLRKPDYDDRFPVTKLLVQDDSGFKVWGSRFASAEKGDRVTFTATVTPSNDDKKFGFFKRPSKASILWPDGVDNDLITCPTCEGNSSACGMCGGRHKVTIGEARRAGNLPKAPAEMCAGYPEPDAETREGVR